MKQLPSLLITLTLVVCAPVQAVPIDKLLQTPAVADVQVSPGGQYIALQVLQDGRYGLLFLDRKTSQPVGGARFPSTEEVGRFQWVNHERVVIEVWAITKAQPAPKNYGELYAVNYDGSKGEMIFGYRAGQMQTGSLIKQKQNEYAWGEMIDPLKHSEDEILIASNEMRVAKNARTFAERVHVYTGVDRGRVKVSKYPQGQFFTDGDGDVRFVASEPDYYTSHFEMLPDKQGDWIELDVAQVGSKFRPIAVSANGNSLFALDNKDSDTRGLYELALDGSNYKKIYADERLDISNLIPTSDGNGVFAMRIDDGYPKYLLFTQAYEEADIFKRMLASFPGQLLSITSRSDDGQFWIVKASADRNPGAYYLYDKTANKLTKIYDALPGVNGQELAPMEPIKFESFDGKTIHGYFTQAISDKKNPPLVVLLHGGPRARDVWGYDGEVQALAVNGYSVLQINFRGSAGYGETFMHAGDGQWGDHIQRDILTGVQWAIANSKATVGKICTMGTSFGAYSAVQSATLAPELFKCVVANAGVYDLNMMFAKGDIQQTYIGDDYLSESLGGDPAVRARMSPVNNVAAIKAAVMVAHGREDERAPVAHAEKLIKALKKNKKDYQTYIKKGERHGFHVDETRIEYMEQVLAFLGKHLQ